MGNKMATLAEQDGVIWLDGKFIPWRQAKVHVLTHTLHYGVGVYEGIRAYETDHGPAIFRLDEHISRLYRSAKIVRMEIPFEKEALNSAAQQVIHENKFESAYLRPMCFYGAEGLGLRAKGLSTHVMIAAWPWGAYLGDEGLDKGISAKVVSLSKPYINCELAHAKANGAYLTSVMALREANEAGCDEAILLDQDGYVGEASGENIFIIRNGNLYTPDTRAILPGITRRTIMQLAEEMGLPVTVTRIQPEELFTADEAFLTGTAAEITPISSIDKKAIGPGKCGPITRRLQEKYFSVVHGRSEEHADWLTLYTSTT